MLREKLMRDVAVPIWYGVSNLVKLSVSEEALWFYASTLVTLVCFIVDGAMELYAAVQWAVGTLVGEAPTVEEVFVDENLYLMPAQDGWDLGAEVKEVISWWKVTAAEVFGGDVIDAEFWTEGCVPCLEAAGSLLCLPPAHEIEVKEVSSRKLVKKARR